MEGLCGDARLDHVPKGMEPISNMTTRANTWWREIVIPWVKVCWDAAEPGHGTSQGRRDVLIVSHGGFIGILLKSLCKRTVRVERGVQLTRCINGSITVVEIEKVSGEGRITRYSDVSHLKAPVVEDNADVQEAQPTGWNV